MKVTAAIFKCGDKVLLMRRAPGQPLAGEWEYPGGKFEDGEDGPTCLHRELFEELGIDAQIGNLITIAKHTTDSGKIIELHAYEIKSYTGEIQLRVHDQMHWVPALEAPAHPQLPADLIVSQVVSTKCAIEYLNSLSDILTELIINRTCYLDFHNALVEQKAKNNHFISWCVSNYYKVTVINLCKLLETMGKRTLQKFVRFWKCPKHYIILEQSSKNAVMEFHDVDTGEIHIEDISQGMLDYLAGIDFDADLIEIQQMHERLKTLRDKKLVHNDVVSSDIAFLQITELHTFIDVAENMIRNYYGLFRHGITFENLKQPFAYRKFTLSLK